MFKVNHVTFSVNYAFFICTFYLRLSPYYSTDQIKPNTRVNPNITPRLLLVLS